MGRVMLKSKQLIWEKTDSESTDEDYNCTLQHRPQDHEVNDEVERHVERMG
jgi:hypothetical protein